LFSNPGFYVSIIFLLLACLAGVLYLYKTRKLNKLLPTIIYFDCQVYEKKDNPNTYFLEKPSSEDNDKIDDEKPETLNENTIRDEGNVLQLKENKAITTDREDIHINNVEINESHKKNSNTNMANISVVRTITLQDYEELTPVKQLLYDKRKIFTFLKDQLALDHPLFSLIFKRSLMDPLFLRVYQLVFSLSMQFAANAMFYSDSYIDKRLINQAQVYTN
jgi:hypothetical protein